MSRDKKQKKHLKSADVDNKWLDEQRDSLLDAIAVNENEIDRKVTYVAATILAATLVFCRSLEDIDGVCALYVGICLEIVAIAINLLSNAIMLYHQRKGVRLINDNVSKEEVVEYVLSGGKWSDCYNISSVLFSLVGLILIAIFIINNI